MMREMLMGELLFLQKNLPLYLKVWPEGQNDWRPAPEFQTLFELAVHLCALPSSTAAILAGEPDEEILQWNQPLKEGDAPDVRDLLDASIFHLQEVVKRFPAEEFAVAQIAQPWGPPATPAKHLLDLVTHMYHHRGQLHNYLRQLGCPVNTKTLYDAEPEPEDRD
jgi:uncharacterized damage-inducible protein DinB